MAVRVLHRPAGPLDALGLIRRGQGVILRRTANDETWRITLEGREQIVRVNNDYNLILSKKAAAP